MILPETTVPAPSTPKKCNSLGSDTATVPDQPGSKRHGAFLPESSAFNVSSQDIVRNFVRLRRCRPRKFNLDRMRQMPLAIGTLDAPRNERHSKRSPILKAHPAGAVIQAIHVPNSNVVPI
jgi:hypothetical protein